MAHRMAAPNPGVLPRTARRHVSAAQGTAARNTGLTLATIAVAPLLAFAVLWTSLLLILGGAWVLHALNLI